MSLRGEKIGRLPAFVGLMNSVPPFAAHHREADDQWQSVQEAGQDNFVQSDDRKIDGETSLRNRAESETNGLGLVATQLQIGSVLVCESSRVAEKQIEYRWVV